MSSSDEEQLKRMGLTHEGDHTDILGRLLSVCENGTPGQAAGIASLLADSSTRAAGSLQRLSHEQDPPTNRTPPRKGPLPSCG